MHTTVLTTSAALKINEAVHVAGNRLQSTSSTVGPPAPAPGGAPPGIPPPGMPSGMPPSPPAAWYTFIMIGFTMPSRRGTSRHTTRHPFRHAAFTTCCLVHLHHDRVHNAFQLLLLGLELILFGELVLIKPIKSLLHSLLNLVLVVAFKLVFELFLLEGIPHGEAIVFKTVLRLDL